MKACWADTELLPGECVFDNGYIFNCMFANTGKVKKKEYCNHWNEQLALELAQEIIGSNYAIKKVDI